MVFHELAVKVSTYVSKYMVTKEPLKGTNVDAVDREDCIHLLLQIDSQLGEDFGITTYECACILGIKLFGEFH